jgi:hypothetical protein
MMKTVTVRPFQIVDGMVLVAMTALALLLVRVEVTNGGFHCDARSPIAYTGDLAQFAGPCVPPFLAAWSVSLTISALRSPRVVRRKLGGQPGVVACCTASAIACLALALGVWELSLGGPWRASAIAAHAPVLCAAVAGEAVAGCWAAMAIFGRWRPGWNWIDRMGQALGVGWVLMLPFTLTEIGIHLRMGSWLAGR